MKRFLSVFIAILLILTLCSCKKSNGNSSVEVVYEYEYIYENGASNKDNASISDTSENTDNSVVVDKNSSSKDTSSKMNSSVKNNSSNVTNSTTDNGNSGNEMQIPKELTDEQKLLYTPTSVTVTLYDVDANSYGITWNTESKPFNPVLQVCEGSSFNAAAAKEISVNVGQYSTYTTDNKAYNYYISKGIIDLDPNKTYTYRAYDKAIDVGGNVGTLTTKSAMSGKFTFIHAGDSQTYGNTDDDPTNTGVPFGGTLATIHNSGISPAFMLHTGDIVEWSKYESYWQNMIDYNWKYIMSLPIMPISGNHETTYRNGSNEIFKHFNIKMPTQADTKLGFFYTFDYGDVKFIMLNTNRLSSNKLTDDQYNWLLSVLRGNNQRWTIVAMHNPMYSIGSYGSNPERNQIAVALQGQLSALFAKNGVDLVLQGHDHAFSKTYPITAAGQVDKSHTTETVNGIKYDVNPKGTIYVMNGAAGNQARGKNANMNAALYDWYSDAKNRSYAEITVDGNLLTVRVMYSENGTAKLYKSYGIKKN